MYGEIYENQNTNNIKKKKQTNPANNGTPLAMEEVQN